MKTITISGKRVQVTQRGENVEIKYRKHTYYMPGSIDDPLLRAHLAIKLDAIDKHNKASRQWWTENAGKVLAGDMDTPPMPVAR